MKYMNNYIDMLKTASKSEHTLKAFKKNLEQFYDIMNIEDEKMLSEFTLEDFLYYLSVLKERYSPTSVNQKLATVQCFYKFLIPQGVVTENIPKSIKKETGVKKLPQFLEIEESKKLMETAKNMDNGIDICLRDRMILQIFLDSGIRAFEMENMKIKDIDFRTGEVFVLGKGRKERQVKFGYSTLELIKRWLEVRKTLVIKDEFKSYLLISTSGTGIGENLKKRAIQKVVKKYVELTEGVPNVSTHKLRHSYATTMISTGRATLKEIQDRLGHEHIETTEIYAHALRMKSQSNPIFE